MELKNCALGIELGSTRVKAVLTDETGAVLCKGVYDWENQLVDGYWTYSLDEVEKALRGCYLDFAEAYRKKYGTYPDRIGAIGISAMMHGYLAFDENDKLLVPFRTWRNATCMQASDELTKAFDFNIPQRWTSAHFYQAVLNGEEHVGKVRHLTTLSGYIHFLLSGERVLGMDDASGMFPILDDDFDPKKLEIFDSILKSKGVNVSFKSLLPKVLTAGENAGTLTEEGARFLDVTGNLKAGSLMCPPEGDAGTGMIATNCIKRATGNVSAGTSGFAMIVLDKPFTTAHAGIDSVNTPAGRPVAMVHSNNFTCELNAWCTLFTEAAALCGVEIPMGKMMDKLFDLSETASEDLSGYLAYNFLSGEPVVRVEVGRPLVVRTPGSEPHLPEFFKSQINSSLAVLSIGLDRLRKEGVTIGAICGHGGFFKAGLSAQRAMSAALKAPITVYSNAGEGGAWGIAVLALYTLHKKGSLEDFCDALLGGEECVTVPVNEEDVKKFDKYMDRYKKALALEGEAHKYC